ncbi:MAG: hypothetical protein HC803_07615 [Saprospiraceae bacterium]|nr:hypothetical protein [Saprospiraceae bacterium]
MKKVNKRKEPPKEFVDAVAAIDKDIREGNIVATNRYHHLRDDGRTALRKALAEDQLFICVYCERSLEETVTKEVDGEIVEVKELKKNLVIEHFKPESIYNGKDGYKDLTLDYNNLFLACSGNVLRENLERERTDRHQRIRLKNRTEHCDTSKGDSDFQYLKNPETWSEEDENVIKFDNGVISADDEGLRQELQGTFNPQNQGIQRPFNLHLNEQKLLETRQEIWEGVKSKISNKFKELTGKEISYKTWGTGGKMLVRIARVYKNRYLDGYPKDNPTHYLEFRSAVLYQLHQRFRGKL